MFNLFGAKYMLLDQQKFSVKTIKGDLFKVDAEQTDTVSVAFIISKRNYSP